MKEKLILVLIIYLLSFSALFGYLTYRLARNPVVADWHGTGYYWIGENCWAYAPTTVRGLEEAIKDCN